MQKTMFKHKTMFKTIRTFLIGSVAAAALLGSCAGVASAQDEERKWTANVGAGFTPLVGALNRRLDNGWNISFGGGYRVTRHFSLGGQVMYNGLGVSNGLLRELSVPDGNAHIWAFTAEPRLTFAPISKVTPYIVGGIGYYRRVVEFTQPTVVGATIFDPFFGFFPVLLPADLVIGKVVRDGLGGNAGLGFQFPVGSTGVKIFTEARFHYAAGGALPTRMVPFTIGIRF
jgi:opacity protein-like surface antigen